MDVTHVLRDAHVLLDQRFSDKASCLDALSRKAALHLHLDQAGILSALTHRESLGSTGLGRGIALPHARLNDLVEPYILLVRLREAIPFDAVDDKPVDIACLVLLPGKDPPRQLNVLAGMARRLRDPAIITAVRAGRDVQAVHTALTAPCERPPPGPAPR